MDNPVPPPQPRPPAQVSRNPGRAALAFAGIYLLLGAVWTLFSNPFIAARFGFEAGSTEAESAEAVNFVVTAGLILALVLFHARMRPRSSPGPTRRNAERFEWIARASADAMWDWDLRSNLTWRSGDYALMFGYSPADLEPRIEAWMEHLHPEDRDRVTSGLRHAVRSGRSRWTAAYRFRRGDGSYARVMDRACILRDEEGRAIRMLGGVVDISRCAQLEGWAQLDSEAPASVGHSGPDKETPPPVQRTGA
jgi:PAS domain S-box-containing protein